MEKIDKEEFEKIKSIVLSLDDDLEPKKGQILEFLNKVDNLLVKQRKSKNHFVKRYKIINVEELEEQLKNNNEDFYKIAFKIHFHNEYARAMLSGRMNVNEDLKKYLAENGYKVTYCVKQKNEEDKIITC